MASRAIQQMMDDDVVDRWHTHIAKSVDDFNFLLENRAKYRSVQRILTRKKVLDAGGMDVLSWLFRIWGTEAMMGIRRELDDQYGVINLRNVLHEIEARPTVLNRGRFYQWGTLGVWCCDRQRRDQILRDFDQFGIVKVDSNWETFTDASCDYVDGFYDHIDPAVVARDRRNLVRDTEEAFRFAQLLLAHRTPKDHLDINQGPIDQAIDAIAVAFQKYYWLITGEPLKPKTIRAPKGWTTTFELAWKRGA